MWLFILRVQNYNTENSILNYVATKFNQDESELEIKELNIKAVYGRCLVTERLFLKKNAYNKIFC